MSEDQQYLMRKSGKVYPTTATGISTNVGVNSSATLTPTTTPLNSNATMTADGGMMGGKAGVVSCASSVQYLIPGKGPNIMISTPTTLINGAFQQFNSEWAMLVNGRKII